MTSCCKLYSIKAHSFVSTHKHRLNEQKEILDFLDTILGTKQRINFESYVKINKEVSSEMVISVMALLQDQIPCSQNIFRMKENYRN